MKKIKGTFSVKSEATAALDRIEGLCTRARVKENFDSRERFSGEDYEFHSGYPFSADTPLFSGVNMLNWGNIPLDWNISAFGAGGHGNYNVSYTLEAEVHNESADRVKDIMYASGAVSVTS